MGQGAEILGSRRVHQTTQGDEGPLTVPGDDICQAIQEPHHQGQHRVGSTIAKW